MIMPYLLFVSAVLLFNCVSTTHFQLKQWSAKLMVYSVGTDTIFWYSWHNAFAAFLNVIWNTRMSELKTYFGIYSTVFTTSKQCRFFTLCFKYLKFQLQFAKFKLHFHFIFYDSSIICLIHKSSSLFTKVIIFARLCGKRSVVVAVVFKNRDYYSFLDSFLCNIEYSIGLFRQTNF